MTNPVAVLREYESSDGKTGAMLYFWCPGCDKLHAVDTSIWEWDGDLITPTISPSILTHGTVHMCPSTYEHEEICPDTSACGSLMHIKLSESGESPDVWGHVKKHVAEPAFGNCHAFLKNGQWQFLGDSVHGLAGQTAQMVPVPDWMLLEGE